MICCFMEQETYERLLNIKQVWSHFNRMLFEFHVVIGILNAALWESA